MTVAPLPPGLRPGGAAENIGELEHSSDGCAAAQSQAIQILNGKIGHEDLPGWGGRNYRKRRVAHLYAAWLDQREEARQ